MNRTPTQNLLHHGSTVVLIIAFLVVVEGHWALKLAVVALAVNFLMLPPSRRFITKRVLRKVLGVVGVVLLVVWRWVWKKLS